MKIKEILAESDLQEKWSNKYKRSIDCSHPKGFSQRAHCQGRKKNEEVEIKEGDIIEPNFSRKSPYTKNPDIEVPTYNGKLFDHFELEIIEPKKNNAHIIGIINGERKRISTAPLQLATVLVDAYNRGGFTDVQIEKVPLEKAFTKPKQKSTLTRIKESDESVNIWNSFPDDLSMKDKMFLFEQYYLDKNLKDSDINESNSNISEIDYASSLAEPQLSKQEIINNSSLDGTIGSRKVFLYKQGPERIFYFKGVSSIDALVYLFKDRLLGIKNYSENRGLVYNLLQFLINIKNETIRLSSTDKLTPDGIHWIIKQIKRPAGFKITNSNGKLIDPEALHREWEQARIEHVPGETEIIISQSPNSQQIKENEQRLMPMDIWGATLSRTSSNTVDMEKLFENSLTEDSMSLHDWFGKGKHGGAGGGGWDRYNTKGERIGKCGERSAGEGKPKCLSKARAASLRASGGKKAIAAAVRKKRREDPNPEKRGKAEMVSNKTRSKK